ncbi:hypothetical protein H671_5g14142 [Cricetulus griseus]|uniref:Uncharacterized protein n=1 Tax=Cricetulus griseus TaxID=10029 RepID=A0A061I345_CRIGR|nr:hypothetical protein H671_5g14142 [Cricetulus griseus]
MDKKTESFLLLHTRITPQLQRQMIRSPPLEEWVLHTANIDYNVQDTGAWVGEAQEFERSREWSMDLRTAANQVIENIAGYSSLGWHLCSLTVGRISIHVLWLSEFPWRTSV